MSAMSVQSQILLIEKVKIKIIKITSLFNMIRIVITRKKPFIYCTLEKLSHFSKYELISNEESASKIKKVHKIINKQQDDEQSVNKNILLNVSIKYFSISNCRNTNFINEINFD